MIVQNSPVPEFPTHRLYFCCLCGAFCMFNMLLLNLQLSLVSTVEVDLTPSLVF